MPQFSNTREALSAFIARKMEIDTILARLSAPSSDHFGYDPDRVMAQQMEPSMSKSPFKAAALTASIARTIEIDTIVARLTALRSDHFSCEPETVKWVDVGNTGELPQGTT